MSTTELYQWTRAAHVVGFILWTGGILSCIYLLKAHAGAGAEGRQTLSGIQRKAAVLMDIGATLTIVAGLYLALGGGRNAFSGQGWLHAKLLLVAAGILGPQVLIRIKIKKFRNGEVNPIPGVLLPVALAFTVVVSILATVKPF